MTRETGHMLDEADVGSGAKGPAEKETEEQIKQVSPQKENSRKSSDMTKEAQKQPSDRQQEPKQDENGPGPAAPAARDD